MPSPICQVKDGAGSYQSTTNGANVTPANTVTIHLVDATGVSTWSIQCWATDELSSASSVTASLTIDSNAKTATFTAPVAGRAYLFKSTVNNGIGPDGTTQASYSTTFGIYTLATGSRRTHAVGESFESNATFGWVADINDIIRNPASGSVPSGTGFVHVTAGVQDPAAQLVANADVSTSAAIAVSKLAASGTNENVLKTSGGVPTWGTVNLASSNGVTGVLPVANGGTNRSALGSALQVLRVNAGATDTEWASIAAGSNTQVIFNDGGSFAGDAGMTYDKTNDVLTLAGALTVGASAAQSGTIRIPNGPSNGIKGRNGADSADYSLLYIDSSNYVTLGLSNCYLQLLQGGSDFILTNNTVTFRTSTASVLSMYGLSKLQIDGPVAGYSSGSLPFQFKVAAITQNSTSDTTLTSSQYECPIIAITGTPGGSFNIIAPNTTGAFFTVNNSTASNCTFKKSGGSGFIIAGTSANVAWHNGTDYIAGS